MRGAKESEDFTEAAQAILQAAAALMAAQGNPDMIKQHSADIKNAATRLGQAGKALIATQSDPASKEVCSDLRRFMRMCAILFVLIFFIFHSVLPTT
jgi:hypothetical protein